MSDGPLPVLLDWAKDSNVRENAVAALRSDLEESPSTLAAARQDLRGRASQLGAFVRVVVVGRRTAAAAVAERMTKLEFTKGGAEPPERIDVETALQRSGARPPVERGVEEDGASTGVDRVDEAEPEAAVAEAGDGVVAPGQLLDVQGDDGDLSWTAEDAEFMSGWEEEATTAEEEEEDDDDDPDALRCMPCLPPAAPDDDDADDDDALRCYPCPPPPPPAAACLPASADEDGFRCYPCPSPSSPDAARAGSEVAAAAAAPVGGEEERLDPMDLMIDRVADAVLDVEDDALRSFLLRLAAENGFTAAEYREIVAAFASRHVDGRGVPDVAGALRSADLGLDLGDAALVAELGALNSAVLSEVEALRRKHAEHHRPPGPPRQGDDLLSGLDPAVVTAFETIDAWRDDDDGLVASGEGLDDLDDDDPDAPRCMPCPPAAACPPASADEDGFRCYPCPSPSSPAAAAPDAKPGTVVIPQLGIRVSLNPGDSDDDDDDRDLVFARAADGRVELRRDDVEDSADTSVRHPPHLPRADVATPAYLQDLASDISRLAVSGDLP